MFEDSYQLAGTLLLVLMTHASIENRIVTLTMAVTTINSVIIVSKASDSTRPDLKTFLLNAETENSDTKDGKRKEKLLCSIENELSAELSIQR